MSLSHERGLEKAWLARPTTEKRVNKRMVATIGEMREATNLPLYFMMLTYHRWQLEYILPQDRQLKIKQGNHKPCPRGCEYIPYSSHPLGRGV